MQENEVNWSLTLRAALIVAAIGLTFFGALQSNQHCGSGQWRENVKSFFTVFGFFSAFGFGIGWTLPDTNNDNDNDSSGVNWKTRRGFWEGSLGVAALFSIGDAAMRLIR